MLALYYNIVIIALALRCINLWWTEIRERMIWAREHYLNLCWADFRVQCQEYENKTGASIPKLARKRQMITKVKRVKGKPSLEKRHKTGVL